MTEIWNNLGNITNSLYLNQFVHVSSGVRFGFARHKLFLNKHSSMLVQLFYFVQFENWHETIRHSSKQTRQNFLNTEFKHGEEINFMSNKHRLEINLIFINCPCPLKKSKPATTPAEVRNTTFIPIRWAINDAYKWQETRNCFRFESKDSQTTNLYQEYS